MARHRSPQGRGAHRTPSSPGRLLAAGAGGAHRSEDPSLASRRALVAAGGAVAIVGQVAFTQAVDSGDSLFSGPVALADAAIGPSAIAPVAASVPLARPHDGFEPVSLAEDTQQADAGKLAKAAGLAEAARTRQAEAERAQAETAARTADLPSVRGAKCAPNRSGFGSVKSWVSTSGVQLRCIFGVATVGGVASRAGVSDHPSGLALDFMVGRATGDELAEYALRYMDVLRIKYVIWKQRINYGQGWKPMEDRGGATANHFDHVHVSFDAR